MTNTCCVFVLVAKKDNVALPKCCKSDANDSVAPGRAVGLSGSEPFQQRRRHKSFSASGLICDFSVLQVRFSSSLQSVKAGMLMSKTIPCVKFSGRTGVMLNLWAEAGGLESKVPRNHFSRYPR